VIAAYITLKFEWFWLAITWTIVGAPLAALLMIWRIACDRGTARRWAVAALGAGIGTVAMLAALIIFDQGPRYAVVASALMFFALAATAISWIASICTTRTGRIWGDLVVAAIPTVLGFWAWFSE
jgi:hypothetical protein